MTPPVRGYRKPGDEGRFKQPTDDRRIVSDKVSPAVEGYFRIPPVWIGETPEPSDVAVLNPRIHHATALEKKLACGINVRVQRDGLFLFDFSSWPLAPITVIPGYVIPDVHAPCMPPNEYSMAEIKAEQIAVFRAQVMNVHQACLTTSEYIVMRRSAMMGFPVNAWNTHKALSLQAGPSYHVDPEDTHALARNVLNNKYGIPGAIRPLHRRTLELNTVSNSLDILDGILLRGDPSIVQLLDSVYMSACHQRDKRFGECIVTGWAVCEQLISIAWKCMLDGTKTSQGPPERMPRDRRKKLTGRDYTASVMVEMLEIGGKIDHELYKHLELARKARNDWAHDMRTPTEREVHSCHTATQQLLQQVLGICLIVQTGGRGGVPQWPIWTWEQIKREGAI